MTGENRKLQLNDLDIIRMKLMRASEFTRKKIKMFHDKAILQKSFTLGQKVLLYSSKLYLFPEKLRYKWMGPFVVHMVFPHGAVEVEDPKKW